MSQRQDIFLRVLFKGRRVILGQDPDFVTESRRERTKRNEALHVRHEPLAGLNFTLNNVAIDTATRRVVMLFCAVEFVSCFARNGRQRYKLRVDMFQGCAGRLALVFIEHQVAPP